MIRNTFVALTIVASAILGAPAQAATKEDAHKMVKTAVEFAKKNGRQALIQEVSWSTAKSLRILL